MNEGEITFSDEAKILLKRFFIKALILLQSRKFWAMILGLSFMVFGIEDDPAEIADEIMKVVGGISTIIAFIMATAWEDAAAS